MRSRGVLVAQIMWTTQNTPNYFYINKNVVFESSWAYHIAVAIMLSLRLVIFKKPLLFKRAPLTYFTAYLSSLVTAWFAAFITRRSVGVLVSSIEVAHSGCYPWVLDNWNTSSFHCAHGAPPSSFCKNLYLCVLNGLGHIYIYKNNVWFSPKYIKMNDI